MGMWWIGSNVLIYLAGIKGIPKDLYEAGAIDGAVGWSKTWNITIPMLSPTIFFEVVTGIIGAFQIFTTAFIISNSDPFFASHSLLFYVSICTTARSASWVRLASRWVTLRQWPGFLFIIIMAVTLVQLWLSKRWVYYESEG